MQALADSPLTGHEIFAKMQAREPRLFMGDSLVYGIIEHRLASGGAPLVTIARDGTTAAHDLRTRGLH